MCDQLSSITGGHHLFTNNKNIANNEGLKGMVEVRLQKNPSDIFKGMIRKNEQFDLTICNPPFHASAKEAQMASSRKLNNLKGERLKDKVLNFGGQSTELWTKGGEEYFIRNMVIQSANFATQCFWFTTLVSKKENVESMEKSSKKLGATAFKVIPMSQGNKVTRIVCWKY